MAKKAERGEKARRIKEALVKNPDVQPKDLAELLNKQAETEGVKLTFKPQEISVYRSKAKTAAGGATPAKRRGRKPGASVDKEGFYIPKNVGAAIAALKSAVAVLGKDGVRSILDI